jgi:class 3 adenylate cyclase
MTRCPACGHKNQEGAKFCSESGGAMFPVTAVPREERKVVTVLFADLVGFTSRSERLDPEDVRALLSPYYARLRAELEHFGGTVEKLIGDAVMALFRAPVAHEDDPSGQFGQRWRFATGCSNSKPTSNCASPSIPARHWLRWEHVRVQRSR